MRKIIIDKIKHDRLKRKEAADQIGISVMHLYNAINGKPLGRNASKKIKKWLNTDIISIADLMGVSDE